MGGVLGEELRDSDTSNTEERGDPAGMALVLLAWVTLGDLLSGVTFNITGRLATF